MNKIHTSMLIFVVVGLIAFAFGLHCGVTINEPETQSLEVNFDGKSMIISGFNTYLKLPEKSQIIIEMPINEPILAPLIYPDPSA